MHIRTGACHCGGLRVAVELSRSPETYHPRACDCDFCRAHAAAWLSDPEGVLRIRRQNEGMAVIYRQGSGQAELLLCGNCGVVVAALYRNDARLYAAVNARAIAGGAGFANEQTASPKTLSSREKCARWQSLWFSNVTLEGLDPTLTEASQP